MTCRDIQELRAYNEIEPFGEERADLRTAIIAATIATCLTGKVYKFKNFIAGTYFENIEDKPDQQQSVEEMQSMLGPAFKPTNMNKEKQHGNSDESCSFPDSKNR